MKNDKKPVIKSASKSAKIGCYRTLKNTLEAGKIEVQHARFLNASEVEKEKAPQHIGKAIISASDVKKLKDSFSKIKNKEKRRETIRNIVRPYCTPEKLATDTKSVKAGLIDRQRIRTSCQLVLSALDLKY